MAASDTLEDFKEAYRARIQAMARTHSALSRNNWAGVSIEEVLKITLEPYVQGDGDRLTTELCRNRSALDELSLEPATQSDDGALEVRAQRAA